MKSIKIKNFVNNMYIKLTYEGLPKNLFKFLLIIMSSIGSFKFNRQESPIVESSKILSPSSPSVRGLGKSR